MVKAHTLKLLEPVTHFAAVKIHYPKLYTLCYGQNPPSEALQASYTLAVVETHSLNLCGTWRYAVATTYSRSCVSSYMVCGTPNAPSEPLQASFTIFGGQQTSPNLCKRPTRFTVVKTHSPKLCKPPTRFAAINELLQASSTLYDGHNSPKLCKPLKRVAVFKTYSPCYTLCAYQHALSQAVEVSYWFTWSKRNLCKPTTRFSVI